MNLEQRDIDGSFQGQWQVLDPDQSLDYDHVHGIHAFTILGESFWLQFDVKLIALPTVNEWQNGTIILFKYDSASGTLEKTHEEVLELEVWHGLMPHLRSFVAIPIMFLLDCSDDFRSYREPSRLLKRTKHPYVEKTSLF